MRLCFFGTSHLAAVRQAYLAQPALWAEIEPTFIGAVDRGLLGHEITNGVMRPTTEKLEKVFQDFAGVDQLELDGFDGFVLTGCNIGPHIIGYIYANARWWGLPSLSQSIDESKSWQLISQTALQETIKERNATVVGGALAQILRANSDKPIFLTSTPRPSKALMQMTAHKLIPLKRAILLGDAQAVSEYYDLTTLNQFDAMDVFYLPQPAKSVFKHLLTRPNLMAGAQKLVAAGEAAQPDTDIMHGNAAYGTAVLEQLSKALSHMKE